MAKRHVVDFRTPNTIDEVAVALGMSRDLLARVLDATMSPQTIQQLYIQHRIPKRRPKHGNFRVVWASRDNDLRDAHRALARRLDIFVRDVVPGFPHPASYGYVRGRGTRHNASQHCGRRKLLRADIEQFFTAISRSRLIARFLQIDIRRPAAEILSALATIDGSLAMGLNASPMLANLVCTSLDDKLQRLATDYACVYTRYADDIAMSGDKVPSQLDVAGIVESEGFRLAPRKFRVTTIGQAHFVTGLSVSDPKGPHVPREFKGRLRQELHYCEKFGIAEHLKRIGERTYQKGVNRIDGTVRYVASIETTMAAQLRKRWSDILATDSARVSYSPRHDTVGVEGTMLVDEAEIPRNGRRLLAIACVTTEQPAHLANAATVLLQQHQADPFSPGRKGRLASKGLHFSDAPEELRANFIAFLPYLPFRGYLAFGTLEGRDYAELYLALLSEMLPRRFSAYDRSRVTIVFEENSRLRRTELENLVKTIYDDLAARDERRPIVCPTIVIGSKREYAAISVPDFLLGVFSRYFGVEATDMATDRLRFERLRDKYLYIVNIDTGEFFSRRHPLDA